MSTDTFLDLPVTASTHNLDGFVEGEELGVATTNGSIITVFQRVTALAKRARRSQVIVDFFIEAGLPRTQRRHIYMINPDSAARDKKMTHEVRDYR